MKTIQIQTSAREELIDITSWLREEVKVYSPAGALLLYCPHTTCGLTINEGADPDVRKDLIKFFQTIAPRNGGWSHAEGNTDAHIKSSLLGVSLVIPVLAGGELALGRWQSVYLYEGDGPRTRTLMAQFFREG